MTRDRRLGRRGTLEAERFAGPHPSFSCADVAPRGHRDTLHHFKEGGAHKNSMGKKKYISWGLFQLEHYGSSWEKKILQLWRLLDKE